MKKVIVMCLMAAVAIPLAGCKARQPVKPTKPAQALQPEKAPAEKPVPPKPMPTKAEPKPPAPPEKPEKAAAPRPKPTPEPKPAAPTPKPVKAPKKVTAPPKAPTALTPEKLEETPAAPAPKEPKPEAKKPEPPKLLGDVTAKSWPVPDQADPNAWQAVWHNPATLTAEAGVLKVLCEGGEKDKTTITMDTNADLSSRTTLMMDVSSDDTKPVGLALAILTTKGAKYFESPLSAIDPGMNKEVSFDLTANNYKTPPDYKEYDTRVAGLDNTLKLCIIFYNKEKATFTLSNMRLLAE